jgi:peptide/nickel transport system substrate-binding protein
VLFGVLTLTVAGCGGPEQNSSNEVVTSAGGEAVILLAAEWGGSWPAGLDPATNTTGRANLSQMNAIFAGLFQLAPVAGPERYGIVGVLAAGYDIADQGRTIYVRLREGVQFSDGTPFDAEAVRFNIERSLDKPCTCSASGWPWVKDKPVSVVDQHTVALHFERPYGAVINAFPGSNVNWIASPTALAKMGEQQFRLTPVGAGPFKVVSNQVSTRLVLERNPNYWQEGRPYLDRLIFQSIGGEQPAYQALLSGDAHVFEGMTSTPLIEHARRNDKLMVTQQPATSPYVVQLNTARPPFDNQRAREAIYHATNVDAIREALFHNWYPAAQSFTGPGGLFHHAVIDGYRGYDLARAKAIVQELGGISVELRTLRSFVAEQVITALQSQWQAAGIEVSIASYEIPTLIREFQTGDWHAMLQTAGSYDPEAGPSVTFRFRSDQQYTGVYDDELDGILDAAAGTFDAAERERLYLQAATHISDNAYAPFLFAFAPTQVAVRNIRGPGVTTEIPPLFINTAILWQDVHWVTKLTDRAKADSRVAASK